MIQSVFCEVTWDNPGEIAYFSKKTSSSAKKSCFKQSYADILLS